MQQLVDNQGFTLIEMLLSVFIISIIAAMVAINIVPEVRASELSSNAKKLATIIEGTRSCAMALDVDGSIKFSPSMVNVSCDTQQQTIYFKDYQITTNFPNQTAIFDPNGIVNQAATITICNQNNCQDMTISVGRSDVKIK